MKKITMFTMASCPFCQRALQWMDQILSETPEYRVIPIEIIDETVYPDIAERYDYYYVPTYYIDGVKVHEGAATREIIEGVITRAADVESYRAASIHRSRSRHSG